MSKAQQSITHYTWHKQVLMYTSTRIARMRIIKITFLLTPFRSCDPYIMTFEPSLPAGGKGPYTLTSYKSPQVRTWRTLLSWKNWFFDMNGKRLTYDLLTDYLTVILMFNKLTNDCTNLVFILIRMLFWQKFPLPGNYRYLDQRRAN